MELPVYNRNEKHMTSKRFYEYRREIARLRDKDTQLTLKAQHRLNVLDAEEKELEKKSRKKMLDKINFEIHNCEIDLHHEDHYVELIILDDEKEKSTHCYLCADYFERMEYDNKSIDPTQVYERGIENIFCGDNHEYWDNGDVINVFYNNILKFNIVIKDY